jgi:hypothetical protein
MKTTKVKDLREGDNLGNCLILAAPNFIGEYCGQRDRVVVRVRFKNGEESSRVWGKNTTVTVIT